MDFFSSLNEVRKNSNQLNAWEKQQRDKDAQRKAYQEKHAPTAEELKQAEELGETVLNVIDTMDDHSETVAENVETVMSPFSTLTMLAGGVTSGLLAWNLGIKPAQKAEKAAIKAFDDNNEYKDFAEKLSKEAKLRKPNGEIVDAHFGVYDLRGTSDWTKRRIESITDDALREQAKNINNEWKKIVKPLNRKTKIAIFSVPIAAIASWFLGNVYETKIQVDSSRIARFQARRELNDPKAFVNYTPEQIAKAKAELEKHPERIKKKQKNNLKKGMFTSIRELIRDRDNYKQTKKLRAEKQAAVTRPLTEAEITQAKKDQEVIQRVVKHINNEAEKNSEKMEVAANVIMGTFPVVGGAVGWLLTLGFEKSGLIKKWVGKFVDKNGTEEAKKAFKELAKLDKKDPKFNSAWKEFYGELTGIPSTKKQWERKWKEESKKLDNIKPDEKIGKAGKKAKNQTGLEEATKIFKKQFAGLMVSKKSKWVIGLASTLLAAFPSAVIATRLQTSSARAGRYTAKRELEKDPTNFIGYSQDELNEVKEVKENKKSSSKIKEYALFIPNVLKQYWDYEKYRKGEFKEKQALNKELRKLDVTDEQLRDAKNLQAKLFNTFDKVDDKSQTYSEATEAAVETAQPFVYMGGILAAISPLIYFGVQAARGKYTPAKITEKVTGFFATSSNFMKTKLFKGYLKGVEKHTATVVNNTDTTNTLYTAMLKDIDILETPIVDIFKKGFDNIQAHLSKTFHEMDNADQLSFIRNKIWDIQHKLYKESDNIDAYSIINRTVDKAGKDWEVRNAIRTIFNNPDELAKIDPETLKKANALIDPEDLKAVHKYNGIKDIQDILRSAVDFMEEIDDPKVRANVVDILTLNRYGVNNMSAEDFTKAKNILVNKFVTQERANNISDLLKIFNKLKGEFLPKGTRIEDIIDDAKALQAIETIPNGRKIVENLISAVEDIDLPNKTGEELINTLQNSISKENFIKFYDDILPSPSKVLNGQNIPLRLKDIPELAQSVSDMAKGVTASGKIADITAGTNITNSRFMKLLQNLDVFNDPKKGVERLAKYLQDADQETYIKILKGTPFSGWEKESVIKSINNVAKMWDNIPKEESKRIMMALVKQFNENPDKFIEATKTGKIMSIFLTPEIKTALAAAGVSWAVFSFVMSYAIESWLADIQLKAGRLGVKTAMDELQDYRYYANVIPTETTPVQKSQTVQPQENQTTKADLLARYKK